MEAKTLKLDSIGVRLATTYGGMNHRWYGGQTDICTLRGHMLTGFFKIVVVTLLFCGFMYATGIVHALVWLTWMAVNFQFITPGDHAGLFLFMMTIFTGGVALFFGVGYALAGCRVLREKLRVRRYQKLNQPVPEEQPSALALAYASWKEKLCYPVNIEK